MKKLQLITKILAVVLVVAIAFIGIYTQNINRMENKVKDYSLGMNLKGARVVTFSVSDETEEITKDADGNIVEEEDQEDGVDYTTEEQPVNSDDVLTVENYEKTKAILEDRLSELDVDEYVIRLDESTGEIVLELPEDDSTDHIVSNISEVGKFEIVDSEDETQVLMDNSNIKKANVLYNTTTSGTTVYLNIEFNKDGKTKLKDISEQYKTIDTNTTDTNTVTTEETESESTESEDDATEEETQKEITMQIDGNAMITTSFDETMENGSIQLSMGSATSDEDELNDSIESATTVATLLDTGNLPIEYEVESNEYIAVSFDKNEVIIILAILGVALAIGFIVLIVKFRLKGLISCISYIGMVAVYALLIRYANVMLTIEGLVAAIVILALNYAFNYKLLSNIKNQENEDESYIIKNTYKDFLFKIIPICILNIVFCFINWLPISSFGMVMFWGLALAVIYNLIVTNNFIKSIKSK